MMKSSNSVEKAAILKDLIAIVKDMTSDWDLDYDAPLGPDTKLIADLEFESIDVVQFVVAVEQHYQRSNLPFEKLLMKDGKYVDEISIGDAVSFLERYLNAPSQSR